MTLAATYLKSYRRNVEYRKDCMAKARACGLFYPGFRREFVAIAKGHSRLAVASMRDARRSLEERG